MSEVQNFKNHARMVPLYHYVLFALLTGTLVGSIINFLDVPPEGRYSASLIIALTVALGLTAFFARLFALKAQDRAIRAEENLRHFVLTGKPLNNQLTMRQIIGLRFASDGEFPGLCARAAAEGLSEKDIKQAVTKWRADFDRV